MHDRSVAKYANLAPGRNNRRITNRPRPKVVQHILLGESLACFVVLHVVVGKDLRQHGEIGAHQRLVSGFMQRQDLLFVAICCVSISFSDRRILRIASPVETRLAASRPHCAAASPQSLSPSSTNV